MCGITGYIGTKPPAQTVVDDLQRLEYRGYDSAGIALAGAEGVRILKAPGKIANLRDLMATSDLRCTAAVAHTRWATHGSPTEANAHPHLDCTGRIAVVHNGIVENYAELRAWLKQRGHEFGSETDTEVISHLIEENLPPDPGPTTFVIAALRALARVHGSYALGIVSSHMPDAVLAARRESPLVIGLGEDGNFIASDIAAIMNHTRRVITLEDGDWALVRRDSVGIFTHSGIPVERPITEVTWDAADAEKEGFQHFMLKEIHEEPRAVRGTLRGRLGQDGRVHLPELGMDIQELATRSHIHIVACGTAYHAGLVGKRLLEQKLRRPVEASLASEFRYSDPMVGPGSVVILVSQSGETADTLAAMREARRKGASALAIANVVGSTLAREADGVLFTQAGPEIGVASTKAYLAQVAAFALLAEGLSQEAGNDPDRDLARAIEALPHTIEQCLALEPAIDRLADAVHQSSCFFFLGRGYDYAAAQEAALKLKEISYIHAEAYAAGEMKHGPLALVEPGVTIVGICTQPETHAKMLSNLKEVKARQGTVLAVVREGLTLPDCADHVLVVPSTADALAPVPTLALLQMLSYKVALQLGCPIDQPRNLAKSVTVE